MVKKEVIRKRLNKVDEYLGILYKLKKYNYEQFMENPEHYGSAERFLHLVIEALSDIGNHIIADENLGAVNWLSDIPRIFRKKNIIDDKTQDSWIKMIGFRNTLVHEYIEIDRKIVFNVLQNNLHELESLKKVMAQFL
jgi:uncharacterized protein YutE (UPF0331/DUF86 family)